MTGLMESADDPRLEVLARLDILDTPHELAFDRVTGLVRKTLRVPISTITFIDGHRQWFKSSPGLKDRQTDRRPAFCSYAIRETTPLVIGDAAQDPRFRDNPFVLGEPYIRAYAGAQLWVDGVAIGTLCAIDTAPRAFSSDEISILTDLAEVVVDALEMRTLAMRDNLTGALSRRAFRSEAERLIALAQRHRHAASCVVLDFDHFKQVNDTHGHGVGDVVLATVVGVCRRLLRSSDIVGRIGGEEFALLLPHTDLMAAREVIEKVRQAIAATLIATPAGAINVSCSFGVAALDASAPDLDELLRRADGALYSAKRAGRNQTIVWTEAPPIDGLAKRRVFKAGRIAFNTGRSTVDCTVRALSESHASLDVVNAADVPQKFKLQIGVDAMNRTCEVLSKAEGRVEVAFV